MILKRARKGKAGVTENAQSWEFRNPRADEETVSSGVTVGCAGLIPKLARAEAKVGAKLRRNPLTHCHAVRRATHPAVRA